MSPLSLDLRRLLEKKVVEARDAAELAAVGALKSLAVDRPEPFSSMSVADRAFRRELRARARQLGSFADLLDQSEGFALLVSEIAYEQWHCMLFARFLAENDLLMHPQHGVAVTLEQCAELAPGEGEPDEWMLAARYANSMLPGIFRTGDPAVRVRFAPEGRQALERILAHLPSEVFSADDSLGWVYQFWQTKKKKEVNASERKIGGADLAPVTQLFTEHYMVAFLLENTLGAWWAGKHPDSSLLKDWKYLRFAGDGTPAAGTFEGWPAAAAEVTMIDPCCGSGHFLVAGFEMLRRMREEEEGLSPRGAADAVLRDNLFGLELEGRCVQIAVFALALAAWKVGGYHELPAMNVACSGVPARGSVEEWRKLAQGDGQLGDAIERLHYLFKDADTLGSLIDPRRAAESDRLTGVAYEDVAPLLHEALARFGGEDPAQRVFAQAAQDVASAASLLAGLYTLVATNPPFLQSGKQTEILVRGSNCVSREGSGDLATVFVRRCLSLSVVDGSVSMVIPSKWRFLGQYRSLRVWLLTNTRVDLVAELGVRSFRTPMFDLAIGLNVFTRMQPRAEQPLAGIDVSEGCDASHKDALLKRARPTHLLQSAQLLNPDSRLLLVHGLLGSSEDRLESHARPIHGLSAGDLPRVVHYFWEFQQQAGWIPFQSSPSRSKTYTARQTLLHWGSSGEPLSDISGARLDGRAAWGHKGVSVSHMGTLPATLYDGDAFDQNAAVILPEEEEVLPALWCFCSSSEYHNMVRAIDSSLKVTTTTLAKVPFDLQHWRKVAAEEYPDGLPDPSSDDPTQWLFKGNIVGSESPLHVAVARLLGYSWPDQEPDELDEFADADGIVCLPPVAGERAATDCLRGLVAAAYGESWSPDDLDALLAAEDASDVETWLADKFFVSHCKLFQNRPFIWQVWDGRRDGFSVLVNYHKLDRRLLERLIYSVLQSWIDRQKHEAAEGKGGAEARLLAAEQLKRKLELILEGEPPYDIYVRWKPLERQPIGWDPDINDGVRLNIRPFVEAGVLRSKFTINWNKDRGKNPDGSERLNDLHFTIAEKRAARAKGTSL